MTKRILTLDFETDPIGARPDEYPPRPVGVSLLPEGGEPEYLAWGHPEGNNCHIDFARLAILQGLDEHDSVLCHNSAFDLSVLDERLGIAYDGPADDSLVCAFMADPYAPSLSLKPQAERHLDMPPEEANAVRDWLIEHGIVRKSASRQWGAHIGKAPGDLVATYANGDVIRTRRLFDKFREGLDDVAYDREMRMMRMARKMEKRGVFLDVERLERDTALYEKLHEQMHGWLRAELRAPELVFTEDEALADAIERRYNVLMPLTPTGKRSASKESIEGAIADPQVRAALRWESAIQYNLSNYMRPFLRQAQATGGWVHVQWNTVRGADERKKGGGARTGRLSSSPNFQNLKTEENEGLLLAMLNDLYPCEWPLPNIRSYVIAPPGQVIIGRDYSQIELRVTAHYEDGDILARYKAEPNLDLHAWVVARVLDMFGMHIPRRIAKNIGFGILYGAGVDPIAAQAGIPREQAAEFKAIYLKALPSLNDLMRDTKRRGRDGGFITTLGGRRYPVEPSRIIKNELRTFEYKLLNYLIQGSSADIMKEAMLCADAKGLDLRLSVHDEPVCYAPADDWQGAMIDLCTAMEMNALVNTLDCPVLTEGYMGRNWAETEDVA